MPYNISIAAAVIIYPENTPDIVTQCWLNAGPTSLGQHLVFAGYTTSFFEMPVLNQYYKNPRQHSIIANINVN